MPTLAKLFLLTVLLGGSILIGASCREEPSSMPPPASEGSDMFPVRPGMPEWARLQSHAEMVAATQLPEQSLGAMSTERLLEVCLDYPLLGNLTLYESPQQGFEAIAEQFNGLRELLSRADVGSVALARYSAIDVQSALDHPADPNTPPFIFRLALFETLLAQPAVLDSMSDGERRRLAAVGSKKLLSKLDDVDGEVYGALSLDASAFVVARTLDRIAPSTFAQAVARHPDLGAFERSGSRLDGEGLSVLIQYAAQAMK